MINEVIERFRSQLYEISDLNDLSAQKTVLMSEHLNKLLNFQSRMTSKNVKLDYSKSSVHANAIENILAVSAKEKFDLSYILEKIIIKNDTWYKIDLVHLLLDSISKKYGWDAVEHMGEFVPEKCIYPDDIDTFYHSILNLNHIYYLNHKSNVYIGEYLPESIIKNEIQLFCHTPHYPTSFNHGIVKGLAKKYNNHLKLSITNIEQGGHFKIVI
ncbi:Spo0E family sporulation regulatory protein-aspartic acid phosphatase [Peribacillus alkalitolerans]|uniref:Spo0E family sporulation regulatory protein-aspartic acid phosphatase n=1 Tax=Peribacillus alkalitolerans TaxID=1550385 RepID=UPI0013D5DB9E|nr:Spo0E family sporulation regulatory protein-aspartic acid phosphatase [Peribacillus alkalitolerans]